MVSVFLTTLANMDNIEIKMWGRGGRKEKKQMCGSIQEIFNILKN